MSELSDLERRGVAEYCQRTGRNCPSGDRAAVTEALSEMISKESASRRGEPVDYLTVTKAAQLAQVKRSAFEWHPLPRPDATFGQGFEGWLPSTVQWWESQRGVDGAQLGGEPTVFWGPFDVADHLHIDRTTLARYRMPTPDARVGRRSGWLIGTIVVWNLVRTSMKDEIADLV